MNILNEYGQFINLVILIGLAVFLFRKIKAIDYNYYLSTFIGSFWAFLLQTIKFKNGIPFKQKAKEFFLNLPHINKKILGKNLLIYYVGCIIVGLIDLSTDKMKFSFYEFFIGSPIVYFFITIFFIFIYFIMTVVVIPILRKSNVKFKADYDRKWGGGNSRGMGYSPKSSSVSTKQRKPFVVTESESQSISEKPVKQEAKINKGPDMRNDSTQRKMCAMCTFWTGNREFIDAGRKTFKYEEGSAKCSGARRGVNMNARTAGLPCFQKWG